MFYHFYLVLYADRVDLGKQLCLGILHEGHRKLYFVLFVRHAGKDLKYVVAKYNLSNNQHQNNINKIRVLTICDFKRYNYVALY